MKGNPYKAVSLTAHPSIPDGLYNGRWSGGKLFIHDGPVMGVKEVETNVFHEGLMLCTIVALNGFLYIKPK